MLMKLLEGYTRDSKDFRDHLYYLNKDSYPLKCSDAIFSNEEVELIHKTGYWMEAIANGNLDPITESQISFKSVADGTLLPTSPQERAWFKVQGRRKLEAEQGDKLNVQYMPEDDEFYSRDGYKKLHGAMYGVMKETHSK